MIKTVDTNVGKIEYNLEIKAVKNINLRINREGKVFVSANRYVSQRAVESFIIKKAEFIFNAIKHFEKKNENCKIENGRKIFVFGEEKTVVFIKSDENKIYEKGKLLVFELKDNSVKEKLFFKYSDEKLESVVLDFCREVHKNFDIPFPKIKFRRMASQWGNCKYKKGELTFNKNLAFARPDLIYYVVAHEFTHFVVPNHSKSFYDRLSELVPDYKTKKEELKKVKILKP